MGTDRGRRTHAVACLIVVAGDAVNITIPSGRDVTISCSVQTKLLKRSKSSSERENGKPDTTAERIWAQQISRPVGQTSDGGGIFELPTK